MHPSNNQCSHVSNTYRWDLLIASCFSLLNVIVHSNWSFSSFLRVGANKCRISVISRLHDTTLSLWVVPVVNNLIRKKLYIWICYIVTWTTTDPMSLSAAVWHHPASALPSIVRPSPFYGLLSESLVCSPCERTQNRKMPLQAQKGFQCHRCRWDARHPVAWLVPDWSAPWYLLYLISTVLSTRKGWEMSVED